MLSMLDDEDDDDDGDKFIYMYKDDNAVGKDCKWSKS